MNNVFSPLLELGWLSGVLLIVYYSLLIVVFI